MGAGRSHDPHAGLVFVRGCGDTLWDIDGKAYLVLICGYSAVNLGHAHPRLLAAARTQLSQLAFCTGASHPWRSELEEKVEGLVELNRSKSRRDRLEDCVCEQAWQNNAIPFELSRTFACNGSH